MDQPIQNLDTINKQDERIKTSTGDYSPSHVIDSRRIGESTKDFRTNVRNIELKESDKEV